MMFADLNASGYEHSTIFYNAEFELILSKVIACYNTMILDNVSLSNNENMIRDYMLYNYLKNQTFKVKHEINDYLFDPELPERTGRIDIRVMPINPFVNDQAYYIIECKRLDASNQKGTSGLNSKYIKEGVTRFVSTKYSTFYKTNGMLGFIVQSMDINKNIEAINGLLKGNANTTRELFNRKIVPDFYYSFCSSHSLDDGEIIIYHLMLDFSKNIK